MGGQAPGGSSALRYLQWDEKREQQLKNKAQKSRSFKKTEALQFSMVLTAVGKRHRDSQVGSSEKLRQWGFLCPKKSALGPTGLRLPKGRMWLLWALPRAHPPCCEGDSPVLSVLSVRVTWSERLQLLVCTRAGGTLGMRTLLLVHAQGSPTRPSWSRRCLVRAGKCQSGRVAA